MIYCLRFHICLVVDLFFFFKQKTAYEMRISDWSSDVCSSDLRLPRRFRLHGAGVLPRPPRLPDEDAAAGRGSRGQRQARGVQRPPADDPSGPHRAPVGSREPADGGAGLSLDRGTDPEDRRQGGAGGPEAYRKSVVSGKSVSERVDLGGGRIL